MTRQRPKRRIVPRGYVWAKKDKGLERLFNRGQLVPEGWTIVRTDPDSVLDEMGVKTLPEKKTPPASVMPKGGES
jgi:hypothetical protein